MSVPLLFEIHPASFGGTEHFLSRLLPRLDRRRFSPLVVAPKAGRPLEHIASLGVPTLVVDRYFSARGIQALAALIRRHRVAIVQSNYYASYLAMAASLAGVPHVWRLGGHVSVGSGARTGEDEGLTLEMIQMLSHAIVCNSHYVRRQFDRSSRSVLTMHNGIEPVRRRRRRHGPFRIGMIAHFTPQKRHEDFIDAAALVASIRNDVTFTTLGRAYPHAESRRYAARMRRLARAVPGMTTAEFPQGHAARDFDVVVLPSIGESCSNAILEAMAAGVPVIAARSGGNGELVRHGETGLLVPPMQPEAIAGAVGALLGNRPALAEMGRAARERARAHFSIEACVKRYEALYRQLLVHGSRNDRP